MKGVKECPVNIMQSKRPQTAVTGLGWSTKHILKGLSGAQFKSFLTEKKRKNFINPTYVKS